MNHPQGLTSIQFIATWAVVGLIVGAATTPTVCHELGTGIHRDASVLAVNVLATGLLFAVLAYRFGMQGTVVAYSGLAAASMPIAIIDTFEQRIPTRLVGRACLAMGASFTTIAVIGNNLSVLARGVAGMLLSLAFYLLVAVAARGGLGAGDVRLAGPCGLALGWQGWATLLHGVLLAFACGALTGLVVIRQRLRDRNVGIPFGPSMLAGTFLAVVGSNVD